MPRRMSLAVRTGLVTGLVTGIAAISAAPAQAAEGSIDHVERDGNTVQVLYSLPGADASTPDFSSLEVSLNDTIFDADGELAADSEVQVRRTTILAIDVSNSMRRNNRFTEAKEAAQAFLEAAPDDIYVGIVTFANEVTVAQPASLDRAASSDVIDGLSLSPQTRLHEGILEAIEASGSEGARNILLLSDGRDTTATPIEDVVTGVQDSGVRLDVIALQVSDEDTAVLDQFARAGNGGTINADDARALTQLFTAEAETLARQVLITFPAPADGNTEGSLSVSIRAAGTTYTDTAFVNVSGESETGPARKATELVPVSPDGFQVSRELMVGGIVAAGIGILLLMLGAMGVFGGGRKATVEDRIAAYTRKGARKLGQQPQQAQGVTAQAVGVAEKALQGNAGVAERLGQKLEAAGLAVRPAEWLLIHAGVTFVFGLLALLLSSGNVLTMIGGLFFGAVLPTAYLSIKRSRRIKAFKYGLADTLQLMSGSLSAGLSLAQSVDTVVREGRDPIAAEFRRALVEARLGVEIEDAMDSVAERMESKDFEWVVMAIRIQREVGGNLSELLNTVAATIREREYLERQVQALSAEGRLSVWILGGLPPAFMAYLLVANPTYLEPLISTTIGFIMLGLMAVLLVVGIVWMKKLVKVEV